MDPFDGPGALVAVIALVCVIALWVLLGYGAWYMFGQ